LRERAAKKRGEEAKRARARKLHGAAILARVQHLARTFKFDYRFSETPKQADLTLRIAGRHVVEVAVPCARADDVLLRLEASLPSLVALAEATVAAKARLNHRDAARQDRWGTHQSLGPE
jgi:hypothetical protein